VSSVILSRHTFIDTADTKRRNLGSLISSIGFGWYQVQVFILCSGALFSEGAIVEMMASLVGVWSDDDGIIQVATTAGKGMLMTYLFVGIQIGTVLCGFISDAFGRRWPLLLAYAGSVVMIVVISVAARSVASLYVFLVLTGIFTGMGVPAALVFVSEVMPAHLRGAAAALMGVSFRLGHIWASFGLCLFMPHMDTGPWRGLTLWAGIPALVFILAACMCSVSRHDTSYFLAAKGRNPELLAAINCMAMKNGCPDKCMVFQDSVNCPQTAPPLRELLPIALAYWFQALVLMAAFFAKEFVAGGFITFMPVAMEELQDFSSISHAMQLLIISACGIPGVFIAMGVMSALPRRRALPLGAFLTVLLALLMLSKTVWVFFLGALCFQLAFPAWQMTTMLLPGEIFPTQVKTVWYGVVYFVGRFGSLVAPQVIHRSLPAYHFVVLGLGLSASILVQMLPETSHTDLTNLSKDGADGKDEKMHKEASLESGDDETTKLHKATEAKFAGYGAAPSDSKVKTDRRGSC